MNYGVGGDRVKNVLWRIQFHKYPPAICDTVIIQVRTNVTNRRCDIEEIAEGIMQVVTEIHKNNKDITILLSGILPGARKSATVICKIIYLLEKYPRRVKQVFYIKSDFKEWKNPDILEEGALFP